MKNKPERILQVAKEIETALSEFILKARERYQDLDDSYFNGAVVSSLDAVCDQCFENCTKQSKTTQN